MRNWHHRIVKVQEAIDLIDTPHEPIIVSVIEGNIEYNILNGDSSNNVDFNNYAPAHNSLNEINGLKKVFLRHFRANNERVFLSYLNKNYNPSFHAVCVTGIIASEDLNNGFIGVIQNSRVINSYDLKDSFIVSKINQISAKNIYSPIYKRTFLKKNSRINGQDYLLFIPENSPDETLEYNQISSAFINNSHHPKAKDINFSDFSETMNSDDVIFIHQELFAYGRDGRGTLSIYSAGNGELKDENSETPTGIIINDNNRINTKSKKSLIVGASIINLDENNYQLLSSGYLSNTLLIPETKAIYSNYGPRIDLVAPSSPRSIPKSDEVGIYAASILNGGEIGDINQILTKEIVSISSNNKSIVLNNVLGVFPGQTIEIGSHSSFLHEIRAIREVNSSTNTITLEQALVFTKNFNGNLNLVGEEVKITVLKISLHGRFQSQSNKYIIRDRRGLNKVPPNINKRQKVFIYNQDNDNIDIINPENGNDQVRLITRIVQISKSGNDYIVEFESNEIPNLQNLLIIPDIMEIKVRSEYNNDDKKYNRFKCKEDYNLDGFFVGQQIKIGSVKTYISSITVDDKSFITSHYSVASLSEFDVVSTAYGNYTNSFGGTSAATPIVTGVAALVLAANPNLNAAEIKHILKETTDKIGGSYQPIEDITKYNCLYSTNSNFGTGRVNALTAVTMAINWDNTLKPRLEILDDSAPDGFNSPDIIINNNANNINIDLNSSSVNHSIKVKIRNIGNRQSFIESDIRLLMISVPENSNGQYDSEILKFEFPKYWHHNPKKLGTDLYSISLLDVKEIGIINPSSFKEIEFSFTKDQLKKVKSQLNYLGNHRIFILAHIAPFDGLPNEVQLDNFRNNKHLTCKEIFFSDTNLIQGTGYLPGNKLDITVGQELVEKTFDLSLENILETDLVTTKVKATKVNREDQSEVSVFFSKSTNGDWEIEGGVTPDWLTLETPFEIASQYDGYKHIKFPHTITVNNSSEEIKIETLNA